MGPAILAIVGVGILALAVGGSSSAHSATPPPTPTPTKYKGFAIAFRRNSDGSWSATTHDAGGAVHETKGADPATAQSALERMIDVQAAMWSATPHPLAPPPPAPKRSPVGGAVGRGLIPPPKTITPGALAGALGKGILTNAGGPTITIGSIAEASSTPSLVPAARAALAKYGMPQFFQRTFQDYNKPGGWTDTLDDSVPAQRGAIARARMILPEMLALRFDVSYDLGKAGDGTIPNAIETLKQAGIGEITGDQSQVVKDAATAAFGNELAGEHAADLYEAGKGVAEIWSGDFVGGAKDVVGAVSDWFAANDEEWARINNEKIAIDVAKQILAHYIDANA